ncbi:MAG: hypothetical protein C0483_19920 [Pirellula sp.]|nr:hypothetical protein [Pirellula sp.]
MPGDLVANVPAQQRRADEREVKERMITRRCWSVWFGLHLPLNGNFTTNGLFLFKNLMPSFR